MKVWEPRHLQVYLDKTTKLRFKVWCWENDITMSQQIRRLIKQHLKAQEEGVRPPSGD